MRELKLLGQIKIGEYEFIGIEGGFGQDKKILFDIQIAKIHNMETKEVRKSINRLISKGRITESIDYIDIKQLGKEFTEFNLEELYNKTALTMAKNIFILSERGYCKLIKSMDDNKSWDIMDELVDNYFNMRQVINSDEQLKANLLLNIYNGGQSAVIASKQLTELEVKEATKPLIEDNKKKDNLLIKAGEKVTIVDEFLSSDNLYGIDIVSKTLGIKGLGRNNFYTYLRDNNILMTDTYEDKKGNKKAGAKHYEAYSKYVNSQQYFKHRTRTISLGFKVINQNVAMFTSKGVEWIIKRLQKDGYIATKTLEDIIKELESDNKVA